MEQGISILLLKQFNKVSNYRQIYIEKSSDEKIIKRFDLLLLSIFLWILWRHYGLSLVNKVLYIGQEFLTIKFFYHWSSNAFKSWFSRLHCGILATLYLLSFSSLTGVSVSLFWFCVILFIGGHRRCYRVLIYFVVHIFEFRRSLGAWDVNLF